MMLKIENLKKILRTGRGRYKISFDEIKKYIQDCYEGHITIYNNKTGNMFFQLHAVNMV